MARKTKTLRAKQIEIARERRAEEVRELLIEMGINLETEEERVEMAGRPKREITDEMIKDVKLLEQEDFMSKYKCTELIYLRTFKEAHREPEEKIVEKHWLEGVIPLPETLDRIGVATYIGWLNEQLQAKDQAISDVLHHLELKGEYMTDQDKIRDAELLIKLRKERRQFKNGKDFMNDNRTQIINYLQAKESANNKKRLKLHIKYNVKQLTEEYGKEVRPNENI